jgi:hypothetical protein
MKKLSMMLFVVALLGASSAAAVPTRQEIGTAHLQPIDQSRIRARINFLDSGPPLNRLVVIGTALGMNPRQTYATLVYDTGSAITGPLACLPSAFPSPLTSDQMLVGFWKVSIAGVGRLFAVKTGASYVPLDEIGAASVRLVVGPPPDGFILQSCGAVRPNL